MQNQSANEIEEEERNKIYFLFFNGFLKRRKLQKVFVVLKKKFCCWCLKQLNWNTFNQKSFLWRIYYLYSLKWKYVYVQEKNSTSKCNYILTVLKIQICDKNSHRICYNIPKKRKKNWLSLWNFCVFSVCQTNQPSNQMKIIHPFSS